MTFTQAFLLFFLIVQVIHFLGTWKLYIKAGRNAWEAAIPVYNAVILMKIINRPKEWYWVILLFIPIVQLIVFPVIWVETIRSFGRTSRTETILVIVTLGFYIYYVNYMLDLMRTLAQRRTLAPTVLEDAKAYDSKSNGRAESSVRRVEEQVRTMKLALEAYLGFRLDINHPAFAWMVNMQLIYW